MTTVTQLLDVVGALVDSTNAPTFYDSNLAVLPKGYRFGNKPIVLKARAAAYGGGALALKLSWYSHAGSTSGSVTWQAELAAATPGDALSVETKAFGSPQSVTTAANTTARGPTQTVITIVNLDSLAENDDVWIRITRTDTSMAGDAVLFDAELSYDDGAVGGGGGGPAPPPNLTVDTAWYVNQSTGNDTTGDGSVGNPWQTFARAWTERNLYSLVDANLTITMVGSSVYNIGALKNSACGANGTVTIQGDVTSFTTHLTGTFSGSYSAASSPGGFIPCATALGSDTHRGRLCRITSGAAAGTEFIIAKHTATNMYPSNALSGAIVAGDAFLIYTPNTQLSNVSVTSWTGGSLDSINDAVSPSHYFRYCRLTNTINMSSSVIGLTSVALYGTIIAADSLIKAGYIRGATRWGYTPNGYELEQAGVACAVGGGFSVQDNALFLGFVGMQVISGLGIRVGEDGGPATVLIKGGRIARQLQVFKGTLGFPPGGYTVISTPVLIEALGSMFFYTASEFNLTSGDCLSVAGVAQIQVAPVGGTTAVSGYGTRVRGPGRVIYVVNPTLTGGTAGADLKTDNTVAAANATLAVAGTALLDTGNGGVIARV